MFVALNRFFKSIELGLQLSTAANLHAGRPDLMRMYILAQMGVLSVEPKPSAVEDRELQRAA